MSNAVPLLPNAMNTFRVFKPLALMASAEKAVHVKQRLGFFEVYVPSDLGGRLRVGFKDPAQTATPDSS